MTKRFRIYFGDLTEDCKKRFEEFLGESGDNYNYFPITTFELETEEEEEKDDE